MRATQVSVQAHDLTKHYGTVVAVDALSFTLRPGVVTGFLGPNGAGKSTTLRMMLGLDRPTHGSATFGGVRVDELSDPMHTVGALLDARAVHPQRSAHDHLLAVAHAGRVPRSRVNDVLEQVGLGAVASRPVGGFSLGMQQRLGIATALLGDPAVTIFDEPLNGLDPDGILWARTLMRDLAAQGRTVLFSSHLMSEMELTADHLLVINKGRLLADAPLGEVMDAYSTRRVLVRSEKRDALRAALADAGCVFVERDGGGFEVVGSSPEAVGRIAAHERIELSHLSVERDTLEQIFLAMTRDVQGEQAREMSAERVAVP
ncbi:ATP-binding cassette domain-containing protein [Demequina aestuarii]|uniref:ATP-binding cassette domain-containing protein n=1 Tax=Demequina aestuarii TaxID=327095 RepID=UPI00078609B6|nr:ATP-binding cassette domain-containing protein [Demequina aestuarii]